MSNRDALQRQRGALAIAAGNAVVGGNYPADPGDYTVLSPPDVFSGWQTRSVSYTATAADVGKKIVVFFSSGFQEVGADGDTCFDNATFVAERPGDGNKTVRFTMATGMYVLATGTGEDEIHLESLLISRID